MVIKTLATFILMIKLTVQKNCEFSKKEFIENRKLKLGFEIESGSFRIIKDKVEEVIKKNSKLKNSKFHVDTYMTRKDGGKWVFENDTLLLNSVRKENSDFIFEDLKRQIKAKNNNSEVFKKNSELFKYEYDGYTSEFHTVGGHDCLTISKLIEEAFFFYLDLFRQLDLKKIEDKIMNFLQPKFNPSEMNINLIKFISDVGFSDNAFLNENFILHFNNEHTKYYIKGFIKEKEKENNKSKDLPEYKKFAARYFDLIKEKIENKNYLPEKNEIENFILKMTPMLVDKPFIQTTIQIPLDSFPSLINKLSQKNPNKPSLEYIYTWLNSPCKDLNSAKIKLCIRLKSKKCGADNINDKVMGLSLLFSQFLINPLFTKISDTKEINGLKTLFYYFPRTSIKKMYLNFNPKEKKVFKCLFNNEDHYQKDYILLSYINYKNEKISNKLTLNEYINSIFDDSSKSDKLSPSPGMKENEDSLGNLDIPILCEECAIIEIRSFEYFKTDIY